MGISKIGLAIAGASALGVTLFMASPAARAQQTAYAIANGGTTLIRFNTNNPGAAVAVGNFNGANTFLDGIDFRPLNGQLYGYLDSTETLYSVNLNTAALTIVATGPGTTTSSNLLGMDFNPTIDRVRVVTDATENVVYNPNSPAAPTVATNLFYAAGDAGANAPFGTGVHVIENAYSNNLATSVTTTQYGIDYNLNSLVTINNNAGTLNTVNNTAGNLGITINKVNPFVGFDIFTALGGVNTAYGLFDATTGSAPTFYNINLTTGAASSIGAIGGGFTQVYSLAVAPTVVTAAPEPASGALALLTASGSLLGIVLRRKKAARS